MAPGAIVIETGANLGFAAACNLGAAAATGELLCFLNPDAVPAEGWREAIAAPLAEGRGWAAWQALVTAEAGRVVNTRGGVVHFTGIAWAGGAGEPVAAAAVDAGEPGFVSGACLALARDAFAQAGGFPEHYFLYHEDVDLSLRLRLAGGRLGVEPRARVDHDYEFVKGSAKWHYLERNRWATVIRTYPGPLLAVLAPVLITTELALIGVSIAGGWFAQKLRAWSDLIRWLPRLCRERRAIQRRRTIRARDFAEGLVADLGSPYLGAAGRSRLLRTGLAAYWALALRLLGRPSPAAVLERSSASRRATSWARILVSSASREVATEKCSSKRKTTPKATRNSALAATSIPTRSVDPVRAGSSRPRAPAGSPPRPSTAARSARSAGVGGPARATTRNIPRVTATAAICACGPRSARRLAPQGDGWRGHQAPAASLDSAAPATAAGARRPRPRAGRAGRPSGVGRRRSRPDEQRQQHLDHVVGGARVVDRAAPEAARVHPHRDLVDPQAVVCSIRIASTSG